ncbi:MAG TPA: rhomboid family intramembrane serine protease [Gemmatimonadales bacterium]|jgi:membrane associated rhomboid family serine protease|nr:rhomboid family intramembrane serine protease [Gemmatimonadales bacterium]
MGPQRMYGLTTWVRRLLVANLLVFLLQVTLFTSPRFLTAFGFTPLVALQQPWTFLTYMFLHGGPLHLAFNLLMLYVFGPSVEDRIGGRAFLGYYLLCGLGAAVLSFLMTFVMRVPGPIYGASGAILGVALAFAWYWPDHPVFVFPLPWPIAAKWLVTFFVAVDLVLAWRGVSDGIAHLAHLGGVAAGLIWLKTQDLRVSRAERHLRRVAEPSVLVTPAPRAARGSGAQAPKARRSPLPAPDARAHAEIDRVLDKISATGIESLTPAERKFLTEMSRQMRDKD